MPPPRQGSWVSPRRSPGLAARKVTANVIALGYFDYGMIHTIPDDLREGIRHRIPAARFGTVDEIGGMVTQLRAWTRRIPQDRSFT